MLPLLFETGLIYLSYIRRNKQMKNYTKEQCRTNIPILLFSDAKIYNYLQKIPYL